MRRTALFITIVTVLVCLQYTRVVFAEPSAKQTVAAKTAGPLAPPDTTSPQATLRSFMINTTRAYQLMKQAHALDMESDNIFTHTPQVQALSDKAMLYFEKAIRCVDFSAIPASYRVEFSYEAVIQLKEVIDRIKLPRMGAVPDSDDMMELDYWRVPGTSFEIQYVKDGERSGEYLFNTESVNNIKTIYNRARYLPYRIKTTEGFYRFYSSTPGRLVPPKWFSYIPKSLSSTLYFEQTVFQWVVFFMSILFFFLLSIVTFKLTRTKNFKDHPIRSEVLHLILPLQLVASCLLLAYIFEDIINLTGRFLVLSVGTLQVIQWLSAAWSILVLGRVFVQLILATPRIDPKGIDASLVNTVTNLTCIFLAICVLFYGGTKLGIPLIPVVTGFGVIGLAISLAARPTIENVIGGLTLFADKPVRIGDFCMFGKTRGKVLHIGLRSTRIRASDRTIMSIPNAEFSHLQLINLSHRDKFKLDLTIGLRYETTATQLRWIITKLYEMLYAHPEISRKPLLWVRFVNFNAYSKDINIRAYINTTRLSHYYRIQEDVLFRLGEIVEEGGSSFAFPTNSTYLRNDEEVFAEPSNLAPELQKFTDENQFPFPDFPSERIDQINNKLKYPPEKEKDYSGLPLRTEDKDSPEDKTPEEDKRGKPYTDALSSD
ncbi:mechanosensitive ion channel family protein [Halodesulfovibrio sp.]|uniref:mechanosensitive ion channel family protein n=1 Tax=Halodesulfovibrio sp. TaxID=1912772 RepID=UPI0025BC4783|nr:mechanosensitive ion channel family protein [Halodesulfovibrio sp.]